jgi:glycosyltransferase involved in cell wall biosynthesis
MLLSRHGAPMTPNGLPASVSRYTLVHVVTGETTKNLILSQVVAPMVEQARTSGALRPDRILIVFLEPARVALRSTLRNRLVEIRRLAPDVKVALVPYVSRMGLRNRARITAPIVRALAGSGHVVFHCRGEWAVLWAASIAKSFRRSGIIADIRGSWPEEALAKRGIADIVGADAAVVRDYQAQLETVKQALAAAGQVLTVSRGMVNWLLQLGVEEQRLHYVPSCVARLTFSRDVREELRASLGIKNELLYCFLGSVESYATIGDGIVPFLRATFQRFSDVRLLMVTDEPETMRDLLQRQGLPGDKLLIASAAQDRVWTYLCAADCGCILKAPGRLNQTWQPIKLGEYLAAGLPVVVSRGIGDVDITVTRAGAGITVDLFDGDSDTVVAEAERVHNMLRKGGNAMREHALRLCEQHFLWSCYIDEVRSAYVQALTA